jgi:alpha-tubulin suppressor-like RCC1 family protein
LKKPSSSNSQASFAESQPQTLLDDEIVQLACGNSHNLLLTASGKAYSFGYNIKGQCGIGNVKNVLMAKLIESVQNNID